MKNYKKMVIGVLCAIVLATSVVAADTVKAGTVAQTTAVPSTSLFNDGEVGVSLSTGYLVNRSSPFQNDYTFNLSAGAFWFPSRYFGVEANVPFYQSQGASIDEVQAGLLFRLPLSKSLPLFKNVAPYVGVGEVYNWRVSDKWAYIAKAGAELRLNSKWGVFVEGQYRHNEFSNWDQGATSVQGGLKLVF